MDRTCSRALRAAAVARSETGSSSRTRWRWRMPVRSRIHSSEVSTNLARSSLVTTCSGKWPPTPVTTLRSTPLTPDQLKEVVQNLTTDGEVDGNEIAEKISELTHHDAGPENVRRVAATLAAAGWPLAGIDVSELSPGDEDGEAAEEIAARLRTLS